MCTIIVTIRTVLWYVMSLAGTLMILVALFTNQWLHGKISASNLSDTGKKIEKCARHFPSFLQSSNAFQYSFRCVYQYRVGYDEFRHG
mgnify:CR=1 FL=1